MYCSVIACDHDDKAAAILCVTCNAAANTDGNACETADPVAVPLHLYK